MYTVAVIGCGAIGLTSALFVQEKFGRQVSVNIFTNDVSPNITSDIAAGLWEPLVYTSETPEDKVVQWSMETYEYILNLWKAGKSKEAGVTLIPVVKLTENKNYQLPKWLEKTLGYSVLKQEHLEKLSKEHNKNYSTGVVFISFTWEASIFLPYLQREFIRNGGSIISQTITNLNELSDFDIIVNCTGIGSLNLLADLNVKPIRGQVARVYAPWQLHAVTAEGYNYIIPNINCVILGGTKQNDFNTNVSESDRKFIMDGCANTIPAIRNVKVLKHQVGLRPGRNIVRLELENKILNGKNVKVLHNYGHGGSGITLCIGCANEVVEILRRELITNKCKL